MGRLQPSVSARPCLVCLRSRLRVHLLPRQPLRARPASTTASPAAASPARQTPGPTAGLLREVKELLGRYSLLQETTWSSRLDKAVADLQQQRRARIAVVGDRESGASALVTAAFDDPLASDGDVSLVLASRRLGEPHEAIALSYAKKARLSPHEVAIPSPWLLENKADIVEIVHGDVSPLQSSLDALYTSDTLVLLVSKHSTLSRANVHSLFLELSGKPNFILVVNTDGSRAAATRSLELQVEAIHAVEGRPLVFAVSTTQAMDALAALSPDDPSLPPDFDRFQTNFVQSGVPELKSLLANTVTSLRTPSSEPGVPSALQLQTASFLLDRAISAAAFEAAKIDDALQQAASDIAALAFVAKEAEKKFLSEIGVVEGSLKVPAAELRESKEELVELFAGRLAWWKLPLRVDDITSDVAHTVDNYLRPFSSKLIFDTGRLIGLASSMSKRTDDLLSSPSFSPLSPPLSSLHSALLLNTIDRAALESTKISSTDLSAAISRRRQQITAPGGPAEVLQLRAQKAVVSAAFLTSGSLGAAVAADVLEYLEVATSVGVGLFGSVLAAWILQRKWGKAQKKFFVDIEERVTGGLEDDLGAAAQRAVDRSLYKARTAVAGGEELLRKRRADYEAFASHLADIDRRRASSTKP